MSRFLRLQLPLILLAGLAARSAAAAPDVVLALDSSRSLSAAESRAASTLARELVVRLPAEAGVGVLSFDDAVHWVAPAGAAGDGSALDALVPAGRFTVLHDALVEGVRALDDGGVLILLSDGRDENSATTFEDVARLAAEHRVRVVAAGAGRADEKTLRRLALLTGGLYSGRVADVDPDALTAEVQNLRRALAADRAARAPKTISPAPVVAAPLPPAEPVSAAPRFDGRWLLALGAVAAAGGILLGFLLARRRPAASAPPEEASNEPERGTAPGTPWPEAPAAPASAPTPPPLDEVLVARIRLRPAAPPRGLHEISLDETAAFQRLPFSESIERTLVLTEEIVLVAKESAGPQRSFRLPANRAVDIGRDTARNTLAFLDPTLSLQHLRLALEDGEVILLDLGSTNGVFVGERRVDAARLRPGDRFRAGMIDFELRLHHASQT